MVLWVLFVVARLVDLDDFLVSSKSSSYNDHGAERTNVDISGSYAAKVEDVFSNPALSRGEGDRLGILESSFQVTGMK